MNFIEATKKMREGLWVKSPLYSSAVFYANPHFYWVEAVPGSDSIFHPDHRDVLYEGWEVVDPDAVPPKPLLKETLTTDRDDPALHEVKDNGQNKKYLVLSEEERAKGFVRPYRTSYIHKKCGTLTSMSQAISETYARNPAFYGATFCCGCSAHFPLLEPDGETRAFTWDKDGEGVGS